MLFGKVIGVINEPGLHFPWLKMGPQAALVYFFGKCTSSTCGSTRSTCGASRSTPKRALPWASASGTRCSVSNPVAFLFKNTRPGGLAARERRERDRAVPEQHAAR